MSNHELLWLVVILLAHIAVVLNLHHVQHYGAAVSMCRWCRCDGFLEIERPEHNDGDVCGNQHTVSESTDVSKTALIDGEACGNGS